MKEKTVEVMNQKEQKMLEILMGLGWSKDKAKCAIYFIDHTIATSSELETAMNMRQPEVSVGIKKLVEDGIVVKKMESMDEYGGHGRRKFHYIRKISRGDLLKLFETLAKRKIQNIENTLKKSEKMRETLIK